ncbi:hypothetical protein [Spiroplasma mirum]|nr:hypothetical protein [Spiroplasma atrichopogonis]
MNIESSFLVWINYRNTKITPTEFNALLLKHQLIVCQKDNFYGEDQYCFRINIGTSLTILKKIIAILQLIFVEEEN